VNCPACSNPLSQLATNGITVDVCRDGCGGIWFDNFELDKVDESFEPVSDGLLQVCPEPAPVMDTSVRRACPCCDDMVMMRHFVSVRREIEVDECPSCGGIFLDNGELMAIRSQFASQDERTDAAREFFAELFDADLQAQAEKSQDAVRRSRRFARMLKLILPSAWIKGKQPWGAY